MEYRKLGKSDLNVSRICMGCMGFGNSSTGQHSWTVDENQTRSIITVVALMSSRITDSSLKYHLQNAKDHGAAPNSWFSHLAVEVP